MPRKPPPEGHLLRVLGAVIRRQRLSRGLTVSDLAALVNMRERTIRQYEQGLRNAGIDVLCRMARACDMPLSLFVAPLDNAKGPPTAGEEADDFDDDYDYDPDPDE